MTFKIKDLNTWSLRLSVRTAGFHPAKGGSIPPGTAINLCIIMYTCSKVFHTLEIKRMLDTLQILLKDYPNITIVRGQKPQKDINGK